MVNILSKENSIFNRFIAELRERGIQRDSMRFRRNLERIGEVAAYEISKNLNYEDRTVITPLGESIIPLASDQLVLATIMRAGIPLHNGLLNYFDDAPSAFVSAYRKSHKDNSFEVKVEYISCGDLTNRVLVLADPMLATGSSMVLAYNALRERGGEPKHTHIVAAFASEQGLEYLRRNIPSEKVTIWLGVVDEELTSKFYIVPGLGDAGDLAYGDKE